MKPSIDLKKAIQNLDSLPAMPVIAQKILTLSLDTDEGELQLLKLIEKDPQMSARIIGLSNTPLFGASKQVTSVQDASMLLGLTRVKSVAVGIAVMSSISKQSTGLLDIQHLWLHSLGVALGMRVISRAMPSRTRPLEDEIFLAGLLHDIGYMVLNHLDMQLSDRLHQKLAAEPDRPVSEVEAEVIEVSHATLGAELARHWDLPDRIIAVLRYHHTPDVEEAAAGQPLIALINLAEKLLPSFGIAEVVDTNISDEDWLALGIEPERADELSAAVHEQAEQAKQLASNF
ncbi:MAG: signal transduction protein [Gallionellaceae bacterium]|nr:MAG: signal transduction protein [Gallionellaceae bacterium]